VVSWGMCFSVSVGQDHQARMFGGRYEVGALLGRGGVGQVYAATDRRLGRPVAVKVLRHDLAEQPAVRRRFETEARAAARLTHPNVVAVYDSGEDDGVPYLVMEQLPGRTLADEFANGPLRVERSRELAVEILGALAVAHTAGIVHRDIKPANVLLTRDGHVKVADFGIAKTAEAADQTLTGQLVATPAYLAPEQAAGEPASPRSDLYALGVVLYEALSGRRPFPGETPLAVLRAIEEARPVPLEQTRPGLPPSLVAVVKRAMARDPSQRFASAAAMTAAIESAGSDTGPVASTEETVRVETVSHDGATQTLQPAPRRQPRARPSHMSQPRLRTLVALGVAVVVAVVVAVTIASVGGSGDGHSPSVPSSNGSSSPTQVPSARRSLPGPLEHAIEQLEQAVNR
jgi:serine/threonine protein kinase